MKNKKIVIIILLLIFLTGCTKTLKDDDNKTVKNPVTGQSLTENILCRPEIEETVEVYKKNNVKIESLPKCSNFSIDSGGYEGLWTSGFVKPLAFTILLIARYVGSAGLALILTSILLRTILYPVTKKTVMQAETMKKAQPELAKLETKYKDKKDQDSMMKKSQEMTAIYKKHNINPIAGCLFALIQLPLFIAFLEAINRVPALFEESFLWLQLGTTPSVGLMTNGEWFYIVLIILVGASTYFAFNMNKPISTKPNDPMKNMTSIMTVMIIVMGFFMPTALCLYWITSNLFTIVQNLIIRRSREAV